MKRINYFVRANQDDESNIKCFERCCLAMSSLMLFRSNHEELFGMIILLFAAACYIPYTMSMYCTVEAKLHCVEIVIWVSLKCFVDIEGHAELQKICVKVNSKRFLAAAATILVTLIPGPEIIKVCVIPRIFSYKCICSDVCIPWYIV